MIYNQVLNFCGVQKEIMQKRILPALMNIKNEKKISNIK